MGNILVVDDEEPIRQLIRMTLEMDQHQIYEAEDGEQARDLFFDLKEKDTKIDLILLDIMLPKLDGYAVLEELKKENVPVIFLSAKSSVTDRVFGLKLGANDYITKPFEPMELLARVEVALRIQSQYQSTDDNTDNELHIGRVTLRRDQRQVLLGEEEVVLTAKEFDLLNVFLENKNIVLTRDQLLEKVCGYDYFGGTRTVDMHVKQLRQKLDLKDFLETIYKVGYKLKDQ